jgi:hypothetical protein
MNDRFAKNTVPVAKASEALTAAHVEEKSAAPTRFVPDNIEDVQRMARMFYYGGLMKKHFYKDGSPEGVRNAIAGIATMIIYGAELGLSPTQAFRHMHVIDGAPTLSAAGKVALVKRSPKCFSFDVIEESDEHCTCETVRIRPDGTRAPPKRLTVRIWWKDPKEIPAATSGVLYVLPSYDNKDNLAPAWARYPGRLAKARCSSWLCDNTYEDVTGGLYSTEEIIDFTDKRTPERVFEDIFAMVDDAPAKPGNIEAPDEPTVSAETATPAPEVRTKAPPTKPAPTRAEWLALVEQIKAVGERATAEELEALKVEFLRFDKPEGRDKRCELWNANEVLRGFWVAS